MMADYIRRRVLGIRRRHSGGYVFDLPRFQVELDWNGKVQAVLPQGE